MNSHNNAATNTATPIAGGKSKKDRKTQELDNLKREVEMVCEFYSSFLLFNVLLNCFMLNSKEKYVILKFSSFSI